MTDLFQVSASLKSMTPSRPDQQCEPGGLASGCEAQGRAAMTDEGGPVPGLDTAHGQSRPDRQADYHRAFCALRPAGGFGLIMADPPWSYEMRSEKGYDRAPEAHYRTMDLAAIKALPVEVLAAPDCILWLWALGPQLPQALEVIAAWGFVYKTSGHWAKVGASGKQHFGTGYILRNAGEPYLIGSRGAPRCARTVRSVIIAPVREHSRKPDEAFAAAEKLRPDVQRLELFSRQRRPGWTVWGNEVEKFGGGA